MMEYKGYVGSVEYDPVTEIFRGEVANLSDVITFEGRSVEELKQALAAAVDEYLEFCRVRGEQPDRPFSGRLLLRMDPQTHRAVVTAAAREGKSVNQWTVETLERAAHYTADVRVGRSRRREDTPPELPGG